MNFMNRFCLCKLSSAMAKGLLFALVRRGSKLNYLDDTDNKSEREGKLCYEKAKSCFQVSAKNETAGNNVSEGNDSKHPTVSKEGRNTSKRLFDLTFQKLSKGCKRNRQSPACSNNCISMKNALPQGDTKSCHRSKPRLVPSVASGYFVNECETNSKKHENGKVVPRIVLTDHHTGKLSACKSSENRTPPQYSRYVGSLPQLRVNEKTTRPSSWNGDSSSRLNDFTDRRSKTLTSGLEAAQSPRFQLEAMTISVSPSARRRSLRSANSLCPKSRQLISLVRPGSSLECGEIATTSDCEALSLPTKDRSVKRAKSWSRGDEKVNDFIGARQNRKIDIFLPPM